MEKRYNDSQVKAIGHFNGPCLTLAGPGSGKTAVITERTKNLITKYHVNPSNILVITFTKAAALEMKTRFLSLMGNGSYPVTFGTFHAVYFSILKHAYNYNANNIVREEQKYALMRELVQKHRLEYEDETEFVSSILGEISMVKNTGVSIEHYYSTNCAENIFRRIYGEYHEYLHQHKLIDFDDMLVYTYELFRERKDILSAWQRKFQYILIDEFQDINKIQFDIVKMLAAPEDNLFVVGDDDQSIYRFRGARPELMLHFKDDYPEAEQILLDTNYRSQKEIVEASLRLIGCNKERFQKKIQANQEAGEPVEYAVFKSQREEIAKIIWDIQAHMDRGGRYEDFAILFRTNTQPQMLMEKLLEYNIPFRMKDNVPNLYEHWISRNVFCYIYAALGDLSRSNILQIINRPARYISRDALDTKVIRWEQLRSFYQDKNWMLDRIDQLVYDLEMLREMAPAGAVNYIRKAIGYDDYLREYANERRLKPEDLFEVLDALQESAVPFKTYEAWFNHMDEYKEQLKEQSALREAEKEGVSLMTMHSCKGLEFKVVYILDTNEGITPHHKAVLEPDMEEERRMFYVAMTRAKDRLHIFYVKERYHKRQTVSRFVVETGLLGKKGDLEKNGKQGRK